jgi:hypothetical protein
MPRGEPPYDKFLHNCSCTKCVTRYGAGGRGWGSKNTPIAHMAREAAEASGAVFDEPVPEDEYQWDEPSVLGTPTPEPLPPEADTPALATPEPLDPTAHIHLDDGKDTRHWVEDLKTCELGKTGLSPEALHALLNPPQTPLTVDENTSFSLELFIATSGSSQQTYRDVREAVLRRHPSHPILSYEQCEKALAELTGIHVTEYHICVNTCIAYVGRFSNLTRCHICNEPRYDTAKSRGDKLVPRHRMIHTPIALQLQAMHRSPVASRLA